MSLSSMPASAEIPEEFVQSVNGERFHRRGKAETESDAECGSHGVKAHCFILAFAAFVDPRKTVERVNEATRWATQHVACS